MRSESDMRRINAWVYIINVSVIAMLAGWLCFSGAGAVDIVIGTLWIGSPYFGHCALAKCCRDRGALALVLALSVASVTIAVRFLVFPPAGIASPSGQDDENGMGFVLLGLPVLQWILIVVVGIVLLLTARSRVSDPPSRRKIAPLGDLE